MLGHLFFEHLLKDGLHTLADSGLYVQLHVVFELVHFRGLVPPFSLNPQPTRHYRILVLYNARSGLTRHEKDTSVCIDRDCLPGHRGASTATAATHTDSTPAQLSL